MKKVNDIFIFINFDISIADNLIKDPNIIFKNLRCLICQGQSMADPNSEFAQTVKLVVKDKISEGKTEKEIYEFLSEKYGEWIVYKPKFNLANSALWILPYVIFVVGGFTIFFIAKKEAIDRQKAIYTYLIFNCIFYI